MISEETVGGNADDGDGGGCSAPDALMRAGRYADAARAWGERLQSMPADAPERGDLENRQALYGSLADVPPQAIAFARGERKIALTRNTLGT